MLSPHSKIIILPIFPLLSNKRRVISLVKLEMRVCDFFFVASALTHYGKCFRGHFRE
jgi:hypothetical protein